LVLARYPDVWTKNIVDKKQPHQKPVLLQTILIEAVSAEADYILKRCTRIDSVLDGYGELKPNFIGSDLKTTALNGTN
jgi:site-specific DNA-methyltransferase (adenine-specific)